MDSLRVAFASLLLLSCLAAACESTASKCTPGRQVSCTCSDGAPGVQVCAEGAYSRCWCALPGDGDADDDPWFPDGETDGAWDDGSDGSAEGADAGYGGDGFVLTQGARPLIAVFAVDDEVLLVDEAGVARFSKAGIELARWVAPRRLLSAAFYGEILIVADGAKLNALSSTDLSLLDDGLLIEGCTSAAMLPRARFVCGAGESAYYVYDATSLALLSRAPARFSSNGPMHAVPGRSAFLVGSSSSSLYFGMDPADQVTMKADAWDVSVGSIVAFDADPAESVITQDGTLYALHDCDLAPTAGCLERTGSLGTLSGEQRFLGLDGKDGTLVGLVDPAGYPNFDTFRCDDTPCILQRIDVAAREVLSQAIVRVPSREVIALRALGSDVLVAARTGDSYYGPVGYAITLLALP